MTWNDRVVIDANKAEIEFKLTGLTEDQVLSASAVLEDEGFEYDKDFTTLYGAQWAIVGLAFMNLKAAKFVIDALTQEVV